MRTVGLRMLLATDPRAAAALELAELEVLGADLPSRQPPSSERAGRVRGLVVDGVRGPDAGVTGPRTALWGDGELGWQACADRCRWARGRTRCVVEAVAGWQPATAVLRRDGGPARAGTAATRVDATRVDAATVVGTVPTGPARLLALDINTNPGWQASVAGRDLEPVVVDGFRQGFVLPAGLAGELEVRFAPDGPYRALLVGGLLAAVLLLVLSSSRAGGGP